MLHPSSIFVVVGAQLSQHCLQAGKILESSDGHVNSRKKPVAMDLDRWVLSDICFAVEVFREAPDVLDRRIFREQAGFKLKRVKN